MATALARWLLRELVEGPMAGGQWNKPIWLLQSCDVSFRDLLREDSEKANASPTRTRSIWLIGCSLSRR